MKYTEESDHKRHQLGLFVLHLRSVEGLSQRALADRVGVSQVTISKLELGKIEPSQGTLANVVLALGVLAGDIEAPMKEIHWHARGVAQRVLGDAWNPRDQWCDQIYAVSGDVGVTGVMQFAIGVTVKDLKRVVASRKRGDAAKAYGWTKEASPSKEASP